MQDLIVLGDNLQDVYLNGHLENGRFKVQDKLKFPGGAANVYWNLCAFLDSQKCSPCFYTNEIPLELIRFIDNDTKLMEAYTEITSDHCLKINHYLMSVYDIGQPTSYRLESTPTNVVVVADYNKGTANRHSTFLDYVRGEYDLVIVDSRYRSTHPDIIKRAKTKIWRCTGEEYNPIWAEQFDYIVWTDGPESVCLASDRSEQGYNIITFDVPKIDPVDTCGAGDTFTAALASQLLPVSHSVTLEEIEKAIPFCIKAAQQVCMKPYTTVWSPNE